MKGAGVCLMPIIPVKKVTIITFIDHEERLLRELGRLGVVDLKSLKEEEFAGFKKTVVENIHKYHELLDRLRALYEKLGNHSQVKPFTGQIKSKVDPMELELKIIRYEKGFSSIEAKKEVLMEELKRLRQLRESLSLLNKFGIRPRDVGEFAHIFVIVGIMRKQDIPRLKEALGMLPRVLIKEFSLSKEESLVMITALRDFKEDVLKVLRALDYREIQIPKDIPGEYEEAIKWIEERVAERKRRMKELEKEYEELKKNFFNEADFIEKALKYSYSISLAQSKMLRSKMMVVLQGWIPEDRLDVLERYLREFREKTEGQIIYTFSDPLPHEKPPTVLRTPKLLKAYLSLVRQYGIPEPHETDPTLISGLLWTIMFGFMFPDLGQGLVIMFLGFLFIKMKRNELMGIPIKSIGKLLIGAGFTAAIFGALTGDVFLLEHVIEPLWPGLTPGWLEKASNVIWLMKIAIYFGIIEVSIGLILAMYTNLKHGHVIEALLGEKGLAGLITFWSMVLAAFAFIGLNVIPGIFEFPGVDINSYIGALFSFNLGKLFAWPEITLTLPLITLIIGVICMIMKGILEREDISLTLGMLFETIISLFSNMLSFVRLAGFNVAHVALAVVIARMLEVNPNMGLVMLLGFNFFALTLELMVVMIQALRLVFYEFMTKFYRGTGEAFRPFRITI